ncbi:MAG: RluA family pseudouridine synthase [Phycisphaerales bacterium]|nr:RluA family pseudouridine synthase [Phycisphaerales bacterium]
MQPPPVIFSDERIVVFDKPTGLLSVPGIGPEKADCLVARAQGVFPGCRIVHRLDRDTSGVIVLGRDAQAHRDLSIQFQEREVGKAYEALVLGVPEADSGLIDAAIRKDLDRPPRQCIDPVQGRPSQTRWSVLERSAGSARLELRPLTGRSHQLRVHLLSIGHPILGDDLYAPREGLELADRLCLHATELSVRHPGTGERVCFASRPPF